MKPELSVAPQPVTFDTQAAAPAAVASTQGSEVTKDRHTPRPVTQATAPAKSKPQRLDHTDLRFAIDDASGRMVVSIVDRETSEVVRQIPAEELLAVARQIEERLKSEGRTQGVFVTDEA